MCSQPKKPSGSVKELILNGARCSNVVESLLMVQWVVGLIPSGVPIELFLVPASAARLVYQKSWYVLSCMGVLHIK